MEKNIKNFLVWSIVSLLSLGGLTSVVFASNHNTPSDADNITICHRTNSATNPYVQITVDDSAVDADTGNDNGKGDHAAEHVGPIATSVVVAQQLKDAKIEWGDIIPPHNNFPGLNWTAEGQAIYNNDCNFATVTMSPTAAPTDKPTTTATKTLTPTKKITPTDKPISTATKTPTPTDKVTPTPTEGIGGTSNVTPTETPSASPTSTPTPTPTQSVSTGGATTTPQPAVQSVQVEQEKDKTLGASTMASTGIFFSTLLSVMFVLGVLSLSGGSILYAKTKKS